MVGLTPDLQAAAASGVGLLAEELEPRWRIDEASFDAGIGRSLVREGVDVPYSDGRVAAAGRAACTDPIVAKSALGRTI
jgi:hypothetical protein